MVNRCVFTIESSSYCANNGSIIFLPWACELTSDHTVFLILMKYWGPIGGAGLDYMSPSVGPLIWEGAHLGWIPTQNVGFV
jgi:hypothetical protein